MSSLVLAPDLSEAARARQLLKDVAGDAGFSGERVFDITVAVSEAAANAIEHAPVKGRVEVTSILYRDRLEVRIEGPGEFQTPDRLGERIHRGLGLPLMAKLADHLALYSAPEGGTLVTLTFYREGYSRVEPDTVRTDRAASSAERDGDGASVGASVSWSAQHDPTPTAELRDLIDLPVVKSLLDDFYEVARVPLAIIDAQGHVLVGAGWSDICTRFHRMNPEASCHCLESDLQLSAGVPEGEFKLYKCKNNMWDIATPMFVDGRRVGSIFSGQFFFEDETPDYELFRGQAQKYGFDEREYMAALEAVPRLSRHTVDATMAFFAKLARLLSSESYGRLRLAEALRERDLLMDSLKESRESCRRLLEENERLRRQRASSARST